MSNPTLPETRPLKDILGEIGLYVASIVAYVAGLKGMIPYTGFQKTASLVTVILTVVALWLWRWPKITRVIHKSPGSELIIVGKVEKELPPSFLERCVDPLRSNSELSYSMKLLQRRVEIFFLTGLAIFSAFQTKTFLSDISAELGGLKCGKEGTSGLRIVVMQFDTPDDDKFDTRLYDSISETLKGKVTVCRAGQVIQTADEAVKIGEELKAAIVIWGNRDDALFQVNIVVTSWDLDGIRRNVPQKDMTDFRYYGLEQIPFLTQYVLSNIFYIKGDVSSAIEILNDALTSAKDQNWATEAGMDNPDVYFLLGTFYQDDSHRSSELEKAAKAYIEAIRLNPGFEQAYLNRAGVWLELGRYPEAISDCTFLIDNKSFLASFAYLIRAQAQPDRIESEKDFESALKYPIPGVIVRQLRGETRLKKWQDYPGAITDFTTAIQLEPQNQRLYHSLGKAYLLNGDYSLALDTYRTLCFSLEQNIEQQNKEVFIEDLKNIKTDDNEALNQAVEEIVALIESAQPQ